MRVDLFDFDLPDERIALRPAEPRDAARLLVVRPEAGFDDRIVRDLPSLLDPGDALVFNDTKVIPAQLAGMRRRGEAVGAGRRDAAHARRARSLEGLLRPGKRVAAGDRIHFGHDGNACLLGALDATVIEKREGGEVLLGFDLSGPALDEALHAVGHIPLPPYIAAKRADDERDRTDYQTIYAREEGAVAAPTAGLHFTPELFAALDAQGHRAAFRDAACRRRHLPAGQGRRHRRPQDACRDRPCDRRDRGGAQCRAGRGAGASSRVGTTSLRLLESAAGEDGTISRLVRARPTSSSRRATASAPSTC